MVLLLVSRRAERATKLLAFNGQAGCERRFSHNIQTLPHYHMKLECRV